jgi:hypothetical protein
VRDGLRPRRRQAGGRRRRQPRADRLRTRRSVLRVEPAMSGSDCRTRRIPAPAEPRSSTCCRADSARPYLAVAERARPVHDPDVVVLVDGHARDLAQDPVVRQRLRPERVDLELRHAARSLGRSRIHHDGRGSRRRLLAGRNRPRPRRGGARRRPSRFWASAGKHRTAVARTKQGVGFHRILLDCGGLCRIRNLHAPVIRCRRSRARLRPECRMKLVAFAKRVRAGHMRPGSAATGRITPE